MSISGGNVYPLTRAAGMLGISFRRLRRQMDALGIQPHEVADDQRTLLLTDAQVHAIAQHLRSRYLDTESSQELTVGTTEYLVKLIEGLQQQIAAQTDTIAALTQRIERMSER